MPILKPNQRAVDGAKPIGRKRTDYTIEGLPGLILRVSAAGVGTWAVVVQVGKGRTARLRRKITIGPAKAITVGRAVERWKEITAGAATGQLGKETLTVAELFKKWVAFSENQLKPKTMAHYKGLFELNLRKLLGHRQAAEIERRDVAIALDEVAKRSKLQADRTATALFAFEVAAYPTAAASA